MGRFGAPKTAVISGEVDEFRSESLNVASTGSLRFA